MVKLGLKPLKRNKRKYSSYKGTVGRIADNHIDREFEADNSMDNGLMEYFFGILKTEMFYKRTVSCKFQVTIL